MILLSLPLLFRQIIESRLDSDVAHTWQRPEGAFLESRTRTARSYRSGHFLGSLCYEGQPVARLTGQSHSAGAALFAIRANRAAAVVCVTLASRKGEPRLGTPYPGSTAVA